MLEAELYPERSFIFKSDFMPPFSLQYQGGNDRKIKERFAQLCRPAFQHVELLSPSCPRIRVGFIVTLGQEGVFLRCMKGILQHLDRNQFDVFLFAHVASAKKMEKALAGTETSVIGIDHRFNTTCRHIASFGCDVINHWKVGSDILSYCLPFAKLAPVQWTSWGIEATSGMNEINYYLSSRWVEDATAQQYYTENLYLLDGLPSFQYRAPTTPPAKSRAELGLPVFWEFVRLRSIDGKIPSRSRCTLLSHSGCGP